MEKPLFVTKPHIINGLFPIFLKNLTYSVVFSLILYAVSFILRYFNLINYSNAVIISFLIGLAIVIALVPLFIKIINLGTTTYYFFKNHLVSESGLFGKAKHSVPYSQITDLAIDVSLWDKLCNAGDLTLHTANDQNPDLVLYYLKDIDTIENILNKAIHKR